jgi:hypothetical protein
MPRGSSEWMPVTVDLERPNAARVYDYLLGGACNFEKDRLFARRLLTANPEAQQVVRQNRAFVWRAVRFCVERGVRQFLDLGSGIPTSGNVHEIAQERISGCRVVYVDNEPVAVEHSKLILERNPEAGVVLADLVDVDAVLNAPPVRRLLDFTRPIAVIMTAVLHFVPDEARPRDAVARYVDAMAPGSFLVLSHGLRAEQRSVRSRWRMYDQTSTPARGRPLEEIRAFLAGTDIVEPGLVWTPQWRPDRDADVGEHPERARIYAAVGRKGTSTA